MNLLLDTHTLLWWDAAKLPKPVVKRIQDAEAVYVSAATAWEISIKAALGKLVARGSVSEVLLDYGFDELPIRVAHAEAVRELPALHRDPFDRIIVAQARVEGMAIVSRDPLLHAYDVAVVWE